MYRCLQCKHPQVIYLQKIEHDIVCNYCGHRVFYKTHDKPTIVHYEL